MDPQHQPRRGRNRFLMSAAGALAITLADAPALAQAQEPARVEMPAQPLNEALGDVGNIYGVTVIAPDALVRGKTAPAVSGSLTAEQAVARLLRGSVLTYRRSRNGGFIIEQQTAQAEPLRPARTAEPQVEPEEPTVTDTIIVVGTKLEQSLQDLEVSAEIFDEERLNREQITDLSELLLKVPNVTAIGGPDDRFAIRGIGRTGVTNTGQGVTSNVYVDGSPVTSTNLNRGPLGLWDVDQAEVLRGSQSSVQGRNALAGGIFIKTADPSFEPEVKFRATYAEGNTYQLAGAFGGPIIDGLLAGRISIDAQGSDGFLTNSALGNIDFNVSESLTIRGKLLLAPDSLPQFSTKLTVEVGESEVFGQDSILIFAPDNIDDPNFFDFDPRQRVAPNNSLIANDNESLRIVSETAYNFTDAFTGRAIVTYEDYATLRTFGDPNDVARFNGFAQNQSDDTTLSVETRLEFDFENLNGLIGAYYLNEEHVGGRDQRLSLLGQVRRVAGPLAGLVDVTPPDTLLLLLSSGTSDTNNYALLGQFDWEFAPRWTLGVGARYDYEELAVSDVFFSPGVDNQACVITAPSFIFDIPNENPFAPATLTCDLAVSQFFGQSDQPLPEAEFEAFLPRVSLTYDINEHSSVFVSLARGYRAGGAFNAIERNPAGVGFLQFVGQYDPEYLNTIEIGTRNVLLDGQLTLNANVFYSEYEDQQVGVDGFDPSRGDDNLIVNAGESTLYGLELTADYDVTDNLAAFVTIGLLETEFDDFPFAVDSDGNPINPADPQFANLAGESFPRAPGVSFTIGGDWEADNGLFGNASLSFTGETKGGVPNISNADLRQALIAQGADPDLAGDLESGGEDRYDLTGRFGWRNDRFQVYVFGSNLLDGDRYTDQLYGFVSSLTGKLRLTRPSYTVQAPRAFGVGVDVNF